MEEKRVNRNYAAMMAVVIISVLLIIVGAILAIDHAFPAVGFIYVMSGFAIIGGCWLVLRFFMKEEYMSVSNYDFSTGILLILAGVLLILQARAVAGHLIYVLGAILIVLGVCILQFFLQCAFMRGPFSAFLNFVFAAAVICLGAAFFLVDTPTIFANLTYFYLGVMFAGILGILALMITFIRSVKYERWLNLSAKRNKEDEPFTETYFDVKRSRERNLEDQPFTVKDLPPEPNPGRLWNEPIEEEEEIEVAPKSESHDDSRSEPEVSSSSGSGDDVKDGTSNSADGKDR
ncbi:MAG: hypothetical protein DUD27_07320 [Lachnospiraceae bacterium]|uniref:DUF308 domain-containing protein n=1 Tax=Candidatus Weimeria bifida TaxID=2599074 RepID=A0A6N7IYA6_9FIRM|nr:hypothetical protein [Candidatus Weimeria bifida]RRF95788.1 MAG: hypothetical protein DUD27_07320 [Lachnospiraceae bacterium]